MLTRTIVGRQRRAVREMSTSYELLAQLREPRGLQLGAPEILDGAAAELSAESPVAAALVRRILDEEPLFVSDEATLWGVWMGDVDEVLERCSNYYGVPVSLEESQQPFWKLLLLLNQKRAAAQA